VNILIKPASGSCNLSCDYCFYHDEADSRSTRSFGMMSIATLEAIVSKALAAEERECTFGFQGGEPTLAGLGFFKTFTALVKKYNTRNIKVSFALQTNGTLIDEQWATFFADNGFLVGLSLDGNAAMHDQYRKDSSGSGTFKQARRAAKILTVHKAEFNVLCVVTASTANQAKSIYRFFMHNNLPYQQYIPCLDSLDGQSQQYSLTPTLYGQFLRDMFDVWFEDRKNDVFVYNRYFENLAGMLRRVPPESCDMVGHCSVQYAIEADGSVYPCDFYMLDDFSLGNINTDSFDTLDQARMQIGFIESSLAVPSKCQQCEWFSLCRNGCQRSRNEAGVLDLCEAYLAFFPYAYERLVSLVR
jgi:uncharacterized protein